MSARIFFAGCGLAVALTISYTWELLEPAHIGGLYLRALPVATVAGGAAIDLIAVALLAWAVLLLARRCDPAEASLFWILPVAIIPAIVLRTLCVLYELPIHTPSTLQIALVLGLPALLLCAFMRTLWRRVVGITLWSYACLGLCVLWILPQLLLAAFHAQAPEQLSFEHHPAATSNAASQTRIVWILFDELSYAQTYEHRQAGLALPAFDHLRSQSSSFSSVEPAGYYTDQIIPALLRGRPVAAIRSAPDGQLRLREAAAGPWQQFDPASTLFADARQLGWSTAIAGWFNPYCRLFGQTVDSCLWVPETRLFPGHMNTEYSIWKNALAPLSTKFHSSAETSLSADHRAAFQILFSRSLVLAADPAYRFVFLHLPLPHPPDIYNRTSAKLQNGGSYIDNLALADRTLAQLQAAIDHSPAADSTVLIVSSDHSMRVEKWRGGQYWTAEDERAFGNHFDPRPVLVLHFPGQQQPLNFDQPFDELKTHELIEEVMKGQMNSPAALSAWAEAQTFAHP